MADVQTSILIDAPAQEVWDVATDVARMGDWVSIHREFPDGVPDGLEPGTQFKQTLSVAGKGFDVEWTATEVDGPRALTWEGTGPAGTTARTSYAIEPEGDGTRFTYKNSFDLPGGPVAKVAGKVVSGQAESEADDSLARLKALIEG